MPVVIKNMMVFFYKVDYWMNARGNPIANQNLELYKNYQDNGVLIQADPEELLEITTTDENGYFTFSGDDYTDRKTITISDASIRLPNGTVIAIGNLGQGRAYEEGDNATKDVGNLYQNGMTTNLNLYFGATITEGPDAGFDIEFVELTLEDPDTIILVDTIIDFWFPMPLNNRRAFTKNLFNPNSENFGKFIYYIDIYYDYDDSNAGIERYTKLYLSDCSNGEDIYIVPN